MGARGLSWVVGAPQRMCITHSDTNSNATISNGNTNTNCGGSGNGLHVEVFAARKQRAAGGGPTDAGMGTEPNGRAGAKARRSSDGSIAWQSADK